MQGGLLVGVQVSIKRVAENMADDWGDQTPERKTGRDPNDRTTAGGERVQMWTAPEGVCGWPVEMWTTLSSPGPVPEPCPRQSA